MDFLSFVEESANATAQIEVNRSEGWGPIFENLPPSVTVKRRFHPDFDHVWHGTLIPNLAALADCDALVLLGDRLTVKLMGQIAAEKEKPFIALWNADYKDSTWRPQELEYALNQHKGVKPNRVVLLMTDDSEPPIRFTNKLRMAAVDRERRERSVKRLVAEEDNG